MGTVVTLLGMLLNFSPDMQVGPEPGKHEIKEAEKIWGDGIEMVALDIPESIRKDSALFRDYDRIFYVEEASRKKGYLIMTRALGRFEYFDYAIFSSTGPEVLNIIVTKYRSSKGAAICSKSWLRQFEGYKGQPIRVGEEINAVSGATISANSITSDIQRCYKLIRRIEDFKEKN